jgi:Domain of unknown function (DUF892)
MRNLATLFVAATLNVGVTAAPAQEGQHMARKSGGDTSAAIVQRRSLIAWAEQLGRSDCANVLRRTREEERAAGKKLAENAVNTRAASTAQATAR